MYTSPSLVPHNRFDGKSVPSYYHLRSASFGNLFRGQRSLKEHRFPHFPPIYFESVITFTNPETIVEGASVAATTDRNPTFVTIERFIEYLRHQRKAKGPVRKQTQIHAFMEYVKKLQSTAGPKDFVFPGYEVVERLYQSAERAEVIAHRTDVRFKRLSRLRIFQWSREHQLVWHG